MQLFFRGLLSVHSRYGLHARGVAKRPFPSKAPTALLPPLPLRLLPGGANQFPGGSCTRCSPAPFTAHYYDNYLVDNQSCVIVGVQATAARMSQETVAAKDMIDRFARWQGREPESVVADATYGNGEFLQWLMERGITPYMRTRDSALGKNSPLYGLER